MREVIGERKGKGQPRKTNRGLMGIEDSWAQKMEGIDCRSEENGAGVSNGEKDRATVTEKQLKKITHKYKS